MAKWIAVCFALFFSSSAFSDDFSSLERHAFVVGNSLYQGAGWPITNPYNDAQDMAAILTDLGFAVHRNTALYDLSLNEFNRELELFSATLSQESVVVFYYAGHGASAYRENYLIPVDAELSHIDQLATSAISVRSVLATLLAFNSKGFNFLFLDSCRDTPLQGQQIRGLVKLNPVSNRTFIGYAANEGETASDGTGRNGAFTAELLEALREFPDEAIDVLFRKVSGGVKEATENRQNPIADNTVSEKVCLVKCASEQQFRWLYGVIGVAALLLLLNSDEKASEQDSFTLNLTPPNP